MQGLSRLVVVVISVKFFAFCAIQIMIVNRMWSDICKNMLN